MPAPRRPPFPERIIEIEPCQAACDDGVDVLPLLQGLLQAWNFNQREALRAFRMASEADPAAVMPYWGQVYALGPGANRSALTAYPGPKNLKKRT